MRHNPAVELLAHQIKCFAAQHAPALVYVRLHLIEHSLYLSALIVPPWLMRSVSRVRSCKAIFVVIVSVSYRIKNPFWFSQFD